MTAKTNIRGYNAKATDKENNRESMGFTTKLEITDVDTLSYAEIYERYLRGSTSMILCEDQNKDIVILFSKSLNCIIGINISGMNYIYKADINGKQYIPLNVDNIKIKASYML